MKNTTFFFHGNYGLSVSPIKSPLFYILAVHISISYRICHLAWTLYYAFLWLTYFRFPTLLFPTKFIIAEIPCGMFLDGMTIKFFCPSVSCFVCSGLQVRFITHCLEVRIYFCIYLINGFLIYPRACLLSDRPRWYRSTPKSLNISLDSPSPAEQL